MNFSNKFIYYIATSRAAFIELSSRTSRPGAALIFQFFISQRNGATVRCFPEPSQAKPPHTCKSNDFHLLQANGSEKIDILFDNRSLGVVIHLKWICWEVRRARLGREGFAYVHGKISSQSMSGKCYPWAMLSIINFKGDARKCVNEVKIRRRFNQDVPNRNHNFYFCGVSLEFIWFIKWN